MQRDKSSSRSPGSGKRVRIAKTEGRFSGDTNDSWHLTSFMNLQCTKSHLNPQNDSCLYYTFKGELQIFRYFSVMWQGWGQAKKQWTVFQWSYAHLWLSHSCSILRSASYSGTIISSLKCSSGDEEQVKHRGNISFLSLALPPLFSTGAIEGDVLQLHHLRIPLLRGVLSSAIKLPSQLPWTRLQTGSGFKAIFSPYWFLCRVISLIS